MAKHRKPEHIFKEYGLTRAKKQHNPAHTRIIPLGRGPGEPGGGPPLPHPRARRRRRRDIRPPRPTLPSDTGGRGFEVLGGARRGGRRVGGPAGPFRRIGPPRPGVDRNLAPRIERTGGAQGRGGGGGRSAGTAGRFRRGTGAGLFNPTTGERKTLGSSGTSFIQRPLGVIPPSPFGRGVSSTFGSRRRRPLRRRARR